MFLQMIRLNISVLTLLVGAACAFAQTTYSISPDPESRIELLVAKTGFLRGKQHVFVFDRFRGKLRYDPAKPEASHVQFEIEAGSIVCKDTWVSANDLKKIQAVATEDMLDVKHHPKLVFTSTAIRAAAPNSFEVTGDLTIRGVTKPAVVTATLTPRTGGTLLAKGNAQVRLTDYRLKPPSAALGLVGTKDEMMLSLQLIAAPE